MAKKARRRAAPNRDRALQEIYGEIPSIPDCCGKCASACGPIAMFGKEWATFKRVLTKPPTLQRHPRFTEGLMCPALSPNGYCTIYTFRPFICRLWGTTPTLACPEGCEPDRWLSTEEAKALFDRVRAIAGPEVNGTLGAIDDLWSGFALEARQERMDMIKQIEEAYRGSAT